MCLNVAGASQENWANVILYDFTGDDNCVWWLTTNQLPQDESCFEMGIYVTDNGAISGLAGGHAFLSFKNITNLNIQFGPIFLKPNEEMTLTKWNQKNPDDTILHGGVWYNRDTAIKDSELKKYVYITDTAKGSALSYIEDYCRNHDSYNLLENNCCTLSTDIWNHLSSRKVVGPADDPAVLKHTICLMYEEKTGKTFALNDYIGYRNSTFNFVKCDIPKE